MTNLNIDATPQAEPEPIFIKGSWESLLAEAQELASVQNDEAIPLFTKIVTRLSKISEVQRLANGERLQRILMVGGISFQAYLTLRGRYDEALAILTQLSQIGTAEDAEYAQYQQTQVLFMAEQDEAAFALIRQHLATPEGDISDWGNLVVNYLRRERLTEAQQVIDEAAAWVAQRAALGELNGEDLAQAHGYIHALRADLATKAGDLETANAAYTAALATDPLYRENLHLFYTNLMHAGQPALALTYIRRDQHHPIRSGFWEGVAHYRLGEQAEAEAAWEKVLAVDLEKSEEDSFSEYVLTHYYLGDEERIGLGNVLQVLQTAKRQEWQVLFLAALGWAIQGKLESAEADLQFAVNQRKLTAAGLKLPYQVWTYFHDLVDEATEARFAKYFDMRWP